ncbi:hypothetical protein F511_03303 [Dorcoceras hygrometricum]|uniref:Uncharacterized protein n=1 Tax=Dorcoceras hygrometricum TaxID=472368 RepID=A0A2Z7BG79_9LAMI|nr:hypothetical protein F511_03303 [Dorcoceras hygrometricum]
MVWSMISSLLAATLSYTFEYWTRAEKVESRHKIHKKKQLRPKKGKSIPLNFKVKVDTNKDWENGRLEMVSVSIPAPVRL